MDDNNKPIEPLNPAFDEELYQKNRKRFLRTVKIGLGIMILLLLAAGGMWYWQAKSFKEKWDSVKAYQTEVQQKHQEAEQPKSP